MNLTPRPTMPFLAEDGIAIGPILFVVAILGILAAAIAAGSGSFTAGTSAENARTRAAAIIQIGQNLKIGMDRVLGVSDAGVTADTIDINASNTTGSSALFSPVGGGISPPSATMANATTDGWVYPQFHVTGWGTTAVERLALLRVSQLVCQQINNRLFGSTTVESVAAGTIMANGSVTVGTWPTTPTGMVGATSGCFLNSNAGAAHGGHTFFQVLAVQ